MNIMWRNALYCIVQYCTVLHCIMYYILYFGSNTGRKRTEVAGSRAPPIRGLRKQDLSHTHTPTHCSPATPRHHNKQPQPQPQPQEFKKKKNRGGGRETGACVTPHVTRKKQKWRERPNETKLLLLLLLLLLPRLYCSILNFLFFLGEERVNGKKAVQFVLLLSHD